ncbi:MAG: TRAP transporter permease [Candidatus Sumerlaeia bacterium]
MSTQHLTPEEIEAAQAEAEKYADEDHVWRHPQGPGRYVLPVVAFCWSLFQLAISSNIRLPLGENDIALGLTLDSTYTRCIHLAFAMALIFLGRPLFRKARFGIAAFSRRDRIPIFDWALAILGAAAALYLMVDYEGLASRSGSPLPRDIIAGLILLVMVLEACRRSIGPALPAIALLFCIYSFASEAAWMPDILAQKKVSLDRFVGQMSLSVEGIYGTPLYVSARIVFLFVLFGAMLERAGGGRFFTQLALSILGGFRGGPAKAAVLSSGLTGMVSGSSIANIVTTGTFTIPLMKKVGYPPTKAAAIEVAASTDGQLAPPIMGAAAFIIAEYVNVPYIDVLKAAIVPAFASYAALLYITHLEACKLGLERIPRAELPRFKDVMARGFHFLIPLFFLIYMLVIKQYQPETCAFYACLVMAVIMIIQRPFVAWYRKQGKLGAAFHAAAIDLFASMVAGAKNMISVALATAGAGIIVGVVSMGLGNLITEVIDTIAMGNIFLMLLLTALVSLIIGMGLPTTATYITMATLTAPVIVAIGQNYDIVIPLMAAHLFVFYFGILADDTPPVGLAAYAAAAIAKSPPVRTGVQAFLYDIRTAILPFMFIFNADLILHNVNNWPQAALIFTMACFGNFAFAALTQGWFITKNKWYEVPGFLAVTFIMFRPDLIAKWIGLPQSQRYYSWLIGLAIIAGLFISQKLRSPSKKAAPSG